MDTIASAVTRADVQAAARRIRGHVRDTPTVWLERGLFGVETGPILKLELMQHSGSFKARGAFNTLLSGRVPPARVAAASGGNHGAAVAFAAQSLGLSAKIFVPEISSPVKIERIRSYGAEVVVGGARYADAYEACLRHVEESRARLVHAYDAPETIAGQGTVALEWEEDGPPVDTVLVAVGGGGLIAGISAAWRGRVRVIGVEPEGAPTLHSALAAGRAVDVPVETLAADSLGAKRTGEAVLATVRGGLDRVVLVPDRAIRRAQETLWDRLRIASEPGGACALAALLTGAYRPAPRERVGVLLCGGNVDLKTLA